MRRPLLLLALSLASCISAADEDDLQPNRLAPIEARSGFELLFDGASTEHWRGYGKAGFPEGWVVEDGALVRTQSGGDLVTVEEYDSFDLRLEWQISPGGNSGIMWHVVERDDLHSTWQSGPEMQVLDDGGHPGVEPLHSAGACYDMYAPTESAAKPVGEWNEVRVLVRGDDVQLWLNGVQVCAFAMGSADWDARVQAGKWASEPNFARVRKGRIALQEMPLRPHPFSGWPGFPVLWSRYFFWGQKYKY